MTLLNSSSFNQVKRGAILKICIRTNNYKYCITMTLGFYARCMEGGIPALSEVFHRLLGIPAKITSLRDSRILDRVYSGLCSAFPSSGVFLYLCYGADYKLGP